MYMGKNLKLQFLSAYFGALGSLNMNVSLAIVLLLIFILSKRLKLPPYLLHLNLDIKSWYYQ